MKKLDFVIKGCLTLYISFFRWVLIFDPIEKKKKKKKKRKEIPVKYFSICD